MNNKRLSSPPISLVSRPNPLSEQLAPCLLSPSSQPGWPAVAPQLRSHQVRVNPTYVFIPDSAPHLTLVTSFGYIPESPS